MGSQPVGFHRHLMAIKQRVRAAPRPRFVDFEVRLIHRLRKTSIAVLTTVLLMIGCTHKVTMRAKDGEMLDGRWRSGSEGSVSMQVMSSDGEVLVGVLTPTPRRAFFENYETIFGAGAIAAETADLSAYGQGFLILPGSANPLAEVVYGESFETAGAHSVPGPLFYWTAHLQGDRRTSMQCFLIGSTHSSRGLGRCKGAGGKEYTVRF
jgi:hypothetical protein